MNTLVLITGGSGYLGAAVAARFAACGYTPVSLSRASGCDITDAVSVAAAVEAAVAAHGPIFACVHAAAAPLDRSTILNTTQELLDANVDVALRGAWFLAKAATPHMGEGSVFVGVTTEALEPGEASSKLGSYLCAKYALRGFLRALFEEVERKGIRVYAAAPGYLAGGLNRDLPAAVLSMLAVKYEAASVEDTATAIVELCVDATKYPSGSSVLVPSGKWSPL